MLAYGGDQVDISEEGKYIAEQEVISDLSAEVKKYESESDDEDYLEESSVGSLANRSSKIARAAKEVHDREKEKKKNRKRE